MSFSSPAPPITYFVTPRDSHPIGYAALVERYKLRTLPHHRWSFAADRGERRTVGHLHVLRVPIEREASDIEHLLFSLRHDGISLPILMEMFATVDRKRFERDLVAAIKATPNGLYHRRLWFLYEWLTERQLAVVDMTTTNYVPLLESDEHFTGRPRKSPRHRVINNLPGNRAFCPLVRKTDILAQHSSAALRTKLETLVSTYDPDLLARALAFLYTKETRSSFAIERERPSATRTDRFIEVLKRAGTLADLGERSLTEIQNRIVEPRYAEDGFRRAQNYIGESVGMYRQIVHFVPPKPEDVPSLMEGLRLAIEEHTDDVPDAVVWAACISFGFVFIHPFEDGNGRLHRFLIHHVLGRKRLTPPGMIVPVSAVMLAQRTAYDATLERFSRAIQPLVDYDVDEDGRLTVHNDTARHYRYFDATPMAEALYGWLERAIDVELRQELAFLLGLRGARAAMREIVDMPDARADLFVKIVMSNSGVLSKRKREQFSELTDDEVAALEHAVRLHMPPDTAGTAESAADGEPARSAFTRPGR